MAAWVQTLAGYALSQLPPLVSLVPLPLPLLPFPNLLLWMMLLPEQQLPQSIHGHSSETCGSRS